MPSLAFTADSRQTEAGRLYNRSEEDETRIPQQKAIDDADYAKILELRMIGAEMAPHSIPTKRGLTAPCRRASRRGISYYLPYGYRSAPRTRYVVGRCI